MGTSISNGRTQYNVIKFPHGPQMFENASIVAKIPSRWKFNPSYMHSFAVTDNYFIVIEQPLSISAIRVTKVKYLKRLWDSIFKWFENECCQFNVICRRTGVRKFTFKAATFFYFHTINAYERDNAIVIDICCYRDPLVVDCMYTDAMENMQSIKNYSEMLKCRALRFVLPIGQEKGQDLSRWNRLKNYAYGLSAVDVEKYLSKHQSTAHIMDSIENPQFWSDFESSFSVENLVYLTNTTCRAYQLQDSTIYCVPERLCDLGCETPRINDRMSLGKRYRFFYAMSIDIDADMPGTVMTFTYFKEKSHSN